MVRQPLKTHPFANLFPMMDAASFAALVEDIKRRGLLHPITLYQGKVLDGRNRLRACRKVGVTPRFQEFKGRDPLGQVVSLNLERRHLSESQRAMVGLDLLPKLEEEAKGRQGKRNDRLPGKNAHKSEGRARDHAAKLVKVSARYIQDAKRIATQASDLCDLVKNGTLTIPEAKALWNLSRSDRKLIVGRKLKDANLNVRLEYQAVHKRRVLKKATGLETLKGRYQIIYADCPWPMPPSSTDRGIQNHYPTMTLEQLKALPVEQVAADNAVLFMWTIASRLKDALELMETWGFEYATNIVWIKTWWGLGHWVRHRHELLLIGRRGKLPTPIKIPGSVIETPHRFGKHSEKPKEVYDIIEGMYPQVRMRRLELFARNRHSRAWHVWGAEAEKKRNPRKVRASRPPARRVLTTILTTI